MIYCQFSFQFAFSIAAKLIFTLPLSESLTWDTEKMVRMAALELASSKNKLVMAAYTSIVMDYCLINVYKNIILLFLSKYRIIL